jgi:nitrite reductase (NO-forming)
MTVMATVKPGRTRTISFTARRAGVFMYHCGTAPVLRHVGMGMYGMIIVDPPVPRPAAQEVMLVQSEFYGRVRRGVLRSRGLPEMLDETPRFAAFNGSPLRYLRKPIALRAREPVRIYLVDAGPSEGSAFHVVGEIFDSVAPDGALPSLRSDVSTWWVPAGGGAVFEMTFDEPGAYPFLTHELRIASKGALGRFLVR